jgi:hypothetical protein
LVETRRAAPMELPSAAGPVLQEHASMETRERSGTKNSKRGSAGTASGKDEPPLSVASLRARMSESGKPTHAALMRDLEMFKHAAVDANNIAVAVRVTEIQARATGMFREPDPNAIRKVPDETLIKTIAGEDADFAAKLRKYMGTPPPGL